jgi:hypothetical protein
MDLFALISNAVSVKSSRSPASHCHYELKDIHPLEPMPLTFPPRIATHESKDIHPLEPMPLTILPRIAATMN